MNCSQCGTQYGPRSYPRFIRDEKDAKTCIRPIETVSLGKPGLEKDHRITWVERMVCDCQWKAMLKCVDVALLDLVLPDPYAQQEIRRRAA